MRVCARPYRSEGRAWRNDSSGGLVRSGRARASVTAAVGYVHGSADLGRRGSAATNHGKVTVLPCDTRKVRGRLSLRHDHLLALNFGLGVDDFTAYDDRLAL